MKLRRTGIPYQLYFFRVHQLSLVLQGQQYDTIFSVCVQNDMLADNVLSQVREACLFGQPYYGIRL